MNLRFYSSSFCEPCMLTRSVLGEVARLVPAADIVELDVVQFEEQATDAGIRSTPTVVISDASGAEVFRAEGVPTVNQVLVALARAV